MVCHQKVVLISSIQRAFVLLIELDLRFDLLELFIFMVVYLLKQ
jgi:hypothetical protein